ncbi:MAG: flagellar biosynthetic protein FliR [Pseudomonadota bacterium]
MTQALADLLDITNALLWQGIAVFFRVGALVALLPAFGERTVPARIKLTLVFAFVLVVAPAVPSVGVPISFDVMIALLATETLVGLVLGIGLRLFILALQTAGSIAAQATSLSQLLGGASADPLPAMGYILIIGGLALAVMAGLHIKAAMLIILSYQMMPMGQLLAGNLVSGWGVQQVAQAFALAFTLAAPFIILSVIYNVALGAINKAMPQLMVAFVGAPVITAGGLFVLFLAAPVMLEHWLAALDAFMANPYRSAP